MSAAHNAKRVLSAAHNAKVLSADYFYLQALTRELAWSVHLSLPAVIIELTNGSCYNLARALQEHAMGVHNLQVGTTAQCLVHFLLIEISF